MLEQLPYEHISCIKQKQGKKKGKKDQFLLNARYNHHHTVSRPYGIFSSRTIFPCIPARRQSYQSLYKNQPVIRAGNTGLSLATSNLMASYILRRKLPRRVYREIGGIRALLENITPERGRAL